LILADNSINTVEPQLRDPANKDFRPIEGGNLTQVSAAAIPQFPARSIEEPTDEGDLSNLFTRDLSGESFATLLVGAFASSTSLTSPPGNGGGSGGDSSTPSDPQSPRITGIQLSTRRVSRAFELRIRVQATDNGRIVKATARVRGAGLAPLKRRAAGLYTGKVKIRRKRGIRVTVSVTDNERNVTTSTAAL
jgi:hypothetical protein